MSIVEYTSMIDAGGVQIELTVYPHETALRCNVLLCPEPDGGYSIHCLNLPGVVSQGDTEGDAVGNIIEAFREAVLYYRESHQSIPWADVEVDRMPGCREKYLIVRI